MSFISDFFSGGVKNVIDGVKGIVDEFHVSAEEKADITVKLENVITERLAVIESSIQKRFEMVKGIIESEMAQGDTYTKRARPTVVYFGLLMIFLNYVVFPAFGREPVILPEDFWWAWGGIVGVWTVGRSAEKVGVNGGAVRAVTGTKKLEALLQ